MNGKEFLSKDIFPSKIVLAIKVPTDLPKNAHTHINRPSHGFAFHRDGPKTYHFWDKKDIEVDANTVIFMPKGSSYNVSGEIEPQKSCYAINFDLPYDFPCEPFLYRPREPAKLLELFKEAEKAWRTKTPGYMEKCLSCLSEIISALKNDLTVSYMSSEQRSIIEPALDFIAENYTTKKISVSELAKLCSISEVYLRKLFVSAVGKSPVAYINHMRLERGLELLKSGEYTVSAVSKECGFSDECYFSREFKKHYGFAPGVFKEKQA